MLDMVVRVPFLLFFSFFFLQGQTAFQVEKLLAEAVGILILVKVIT